MKLEVQESEKHIPVYRSEKIWGPEKETTEAT